MMSLMPSRTTTARTPGADSTSWSNRDNAFGLVTLVSSRLPLIPALSTPRRVGPGSAISRRARWSGQRRWASGVEQVPSVIESPKATTAPTASPSTSTPHTCGQDAIVAVNTAPDSSAVWSPAPDRKLVW